MSWLHEILQSILHTCLIGLNNWVSNWSCDREKSGLLLNVLILRSVNCLQFNSDVRHCILKCAESRSHNAHDNWKILQLVQNEHNERKQVIIISCSSKNMFWFLHFYMNITTTKWNQEIHPSNTWEQKLDPNSVSRTSFVYSNTHQLDCSSK